MEPLSAETQTLVVHLAPDTAGEWHIVVEESGARRSYTLQPFTCSVQAWCPSNANLIRARLRFPGGGASAAIQSNRQLLDMISSWLRLPS